MAQLKALGLSVLAISALTISTGCSHINRAGANVALGFASTYIVPPIFTMDDTDMACASSNAMTPMIHATKAMGADAAKLGILMYSGAGLCAEDRAVEEELRYMRAAKVGNVPEAQDARIAQKRWSAMAAKRQYEAYKLFAERWETKYKIRLGEGDCPRMKSDIEQTNYFLGFLSGLQAVQNDVASQNMVNVPKDIAAKVERGMKCLDNDKFWGAPLAIRAAIWTLLPGANIGKPDPFKVMQEQAKLGESKGVRITHAIYAMASVASGDEKRVRDAIKLYGKTVDAEIAVNPEFKLFDKMGGIIVRNVADRYWTENTGTRAPIGTGLTQFWDEKPKDDDTVDVDLDDIL